MSWKLRGGVRYGNSFPDSTFVMWPLSRLKVTRDAVEIVIPWRRFHFPRSGIVRLAKVTGKVALGVQFEHHVLELPNLFIFWSYNFPEVRAQFEQNGYVIAGVQR